MIHTNTKFPFRIRARTSWIRALGAWRKPCREIRTGHVHGRERFEDKQPSADYTDGVVRWKNDVRLYFYPATFLPSGPHRRQPQPTPVFRCWQRGLRLCRNGRRWGECSLRTGKALYCMDKPWAENWGAIQLPSTAT